METSMVERSRILCWDTLYIAVKENTTKTIAKNDVFSFFTKERRRNYGNLAQLCIWERQMAALAEGACEIPPFQGPGIRLFLGN